jgi:pimeloyl-ACP methyl ester carboxylesterase
MEGLGAPEVEFFNTFNRLQMRARFVRDPQQSWYSKPIPSPGETTDEIALAIRRLADEHFPGRKIVTIGNSMGAYAAMVFGVLSDFHSALCFALEIFA